GKASGDRRLPSQQRRSRLQEQPSPKQRKLRGPSGRNLSVRLRAPPGLLRVRQSPRLRQSAACQQRLRPPKPTKNKQAAARMAAGVSACETVGEGPVPSFLVGEGPVPSFFAFPRQPPPNPAQGASILAKRLALLQCAGMLCLS